MTLTVSSTPAVLVRLMRSAGGVTLLLLLLPLAAAAQTSATDGSTPAGLSRGAPAGSYSLSGFDNVNLYNGNLNASLPLLSIGGRGSAQTSIMLSLNSKGWKVERYFDEFYQANVPDPNWWTGYDPGYGPGILQGRFAGLQTRRCREVSYPYAYFDVSKYTFTTLTFTTSDGTEYELRDQNTLGQPLTSTACNTQQGPSRGTVFVTVDGSAATFVSDSTIYDMTDPDPGSIITPSGYLLLRDGTRYRIDAGTVTWMRDRNGNRLSFTYDANKRVTSITDSLNRQVTIAYDVADVAPYGLCDRITFKGAGGQQRVIRVSKTSLGNALRADFSLQTPKQLFPELDGGGTPYNPTVAWKVWLPNSDGTGQHYQYYQLFYNSYGELARVELPTGGAVEYDMTMLPLSSTGLEIYRRVSERRVYAGGPGPESRTTFSAVQSFGSDPWPWTTTVTVDQLSGGGQLLARSKHYFDGSGVALGQYPNTTQKFYVYRAWDEGREYKTETFDVINGSPSANPLRREESAFQQRAAVPWWGAWATQFGLNAAREPGNDVRLTETVTTLVDTNQVAKKSFTYDQYNNQTGVYEYDFGAGAPGAFVRRMQTDYLTTNPVNGTDYTTTAVHLRSLPAQVSVYDAAGTERARTTYEYDNYASDPAHAPLAGRAGISGLDAGYTTGYTLRGNVTRVSRWLLPAGTELRAYSQYDVAGNVVKSIDPRGYQMTIDYADRFGQPNGEARANSAPAELSSVGQASYAFVTSATNTLGQTAYTQFDYYLGRPVDGEDVNGVTSSGYFADPLDRPTQVVRASNQPAPVKSQTTFAYDDANRRATTTSDRDAFGDNLLKTEVVYDVLGRTTETRSYETATAYVTTKQVYDPLGRAFQTSNPYRAGDAVLWTTSAYDGLGRVTGVTTPDGATFSTAYPGNAVTVTDQAGRVRRSVTDALGRLARVDEPDATGYLGDVNAPVQPTSYAYSALDDLLTVTQGVQTRTFQYDTLRRLVSAQQPESGTTSYQYDAGGNLTQRTDARGVVTTISYDALNRPTSKTYAGDGGLTPPVNFYYDGQALPPGAPAFSRGLSVGRLVAVTYGGASAGTYRGYDAAGRVVRQVQQTDSVNYLVDAAYNASAMTSQTYPAVPGYADRRTVSYTFDGAGRLASFNSAATSFGAAASLTGVTYAAHGALAAETYGNGLLHQMSYNSRLQVTDVKLGTGAAPTSHLWLSYNYGTTVNNGNVLGVSYAGGGLSYTQAFSYDSLNRLQTAQENGGASWSQTNAYDRYGNRAVTGSGVGFDIYTNRLAGRPYDAAGNLLNDGLHGYGYDAENRLKTVDGATGYGYDGEGRRVRKYAGESTRFVYGIGGELLAEYDAATGGLRKEYVCGGGVLATVEPVAGTRYSTADALGSPRVVTNAAGAVVSRHDYQPYGEELLAGTGGRSSAQGYGGADNLRQHFTGYERDAETGQEFAQARYYSGTQGRYTSTDPVYFQLGMAIDPQRFNLYAYGRNNPLKWTDPDGERLYLRGDADWLRLNVLYEMVGGQANFDRYFDISNGQVVLREGVDISQANAGVQELAGLVNATENYVYFAGNDGTAAADLFQGSRNSRGRITRSGRERANEFTGNNDQRRGGSLVGTTGRQGAPQPANLANGDPVFAVIAYNTDAVFTQTGVSTQYTESSGRIRPPLEFEAQSEGAGQVIRPVSFFIHESTENRRFSQIGAANANYERAHTHAMHREAVIRRELHITGGFAGGAVERRVPR